MGELTCMYHLVPLKVGVERKASPTVAALVRQIGAMHHHLVGREAAAVEERLGAVGTFERLFVQWNNARV